MLTKYRRTLQTCSQYLLHGPTMRFLKFYSSALWLSLICSVWGDDSFCHRDGHCDQPFYYETTALDYNDCLTTCKKDFDCNHFSFIEANTFNCLLFNTDYCYISFSLCGDQPCFSGKSTCHLYNEVDPNVPEGGCGLAGICDGQLIDEQVVETEQECIEHCGSTNGCFWSTYAEESSNCRLLQTCTSFDESVNATTSFKMCAPGA